jgi:predicted DNA-binding transcriptional regulator
VIPCARCGAEPLNPAARFCSKCGAALSNVTTHRVPGAIRFFALPFILIGRAIANPVRWRQERIRWLTAASGPQSPINEVASLSVGAKQVYAYLASVTLRFGSSHSRIRTIARVAGLSEHKARAAIRELERRGLLSHERRNTWHGRGAHSYHVRPVKHDQG